MSDKQTVHVTDFIDTHFFADRPHIRGRRIPVATIVRHAQKQGWSVAELAYQFSLSAEQVQAALDYYANHTDLIEQQEAVYQAELDEAQRQFDESQR